MNPNRRKFLGHTLGTAMVGAMGAACCATAQGDDLSDLTVASAVLANMPSEDGANPERANQEQPFTPIAVGSDWQLFVDDYLIAHMENTTLRVHSSQRREIAFTFDAPWEGDA